MTCSSSMRKRCCDSARQTGEKLGLWRTQDSVCDQILCLFGTPRLTARSERLFSPLVGVCTGALFGASFGASFPGILYLKMLKLTRDELLPAIGSLFIVSTLAWLGRSRALDVKVNGLLSSVWLVIPAGVGLLFGYTLRREVEDRDYDRWFACGLLFVGAGVLTCSLAKVS